MAVSLKSICAGQLRTPIAVQEAARTPDAAGGFSAAAWSDLKTVFGTFTEKSGREMTEGGRLIAYKRVEAILRYDPAIVVGQRLVVDGLAYNIRRVDDIERRKRYLLVECDSGVAD